jgi:type III protein arginine methyltransferase
MLLTPSDAATRLAEGLAFHQQGRLDEAEACYLDVIDAEPRNSEALKLLAILSVARSKFEDALNYALAAIELSPTTGDYYALAGRICLDMGDGVAAMQHLQNALTRMPSEPRNVNLDLAECYGLNGSWGESLAIAQSQAYAYPTDTRALESVATAATALDDVDLALQSYDSILALDAGHVAALVGASKIYRASGDLSKAWLYAERALASAPQDANVHYMTRIIRAEIVPAWHFNMMNDATRNTAFRQAIARQIKPHHVVLEIGTGAGLLAMMAARTGARVYTCETNLALAMTARGVIAQNGFSNKISIIDKASWEMDVGVDIPQQADVLIAEIFSAQFLSEDIIPTIEDAKARLLKPGGIVIPAGGSLIAALVQSDELAHLTRVTQVEGLSFDSFNAFSPVLMNMDTPDIALNWLSEPTKVFSFDFQNADEFPAQQSQASVQVTTDGLCQGVVQWMQLQLDDTITYENPPGGPAAVRTKHWTPLFYPFPMPIQVKQGQTVILRTGHDRKGVRLELDRVV